MRKVFGFVSALAGGYLLYWAFKIVRVLLGLDDARFDGTLMAIAGVTAVVGAGLMTLGWRLFRNPSPPPSSSHPPGTPRP